MCNKNLHERIIPFVTILLALAYIIGFVAWNYYLAGFGFFEIQLLQTRFISAGLLVLLPLLILLYLWRRLRHWLINLFKNHPLKFIICAGVYLSLFVAFIFPATPQYLGGARPFAAALIGTPDQIKYLNNFGIKGVANGNNPPIQTQNLCITYQNTDFLIIGYQEVSFPALMCSMYSYNQQRIIPLKRDQITGTQTTFSDKELCTLFIKQAQQLPFL